MAANTMLPAQRTGSPGSTKRVSTKPSQAYVPSAAATSASWCRGPHDALPGKPGQQHGQQRQPGDPEHEPAPAFRPHLVDAHGQERDEP